jgi:hypothetical protein
VARSFIEKGGTATASGEAAFDAIAAMAEPAQAVAAETRTTNDIGARSRSPPHAFISRAAKSRPRGRASLWFGANNATKSYDNEKN